LFRATGLLSLSSRDTANAASSAGPVNIDVLAGGFIIAGVAEPAIGNVSWTGLTERAEDDLDSGSTGRTQSSASIASATDQTVAVTAAFTASSSFNRLAAVSWR
jgi:hypothetical protein